MDDGFVLLDNNEDKHLLPLNKLKVGERVVVGNECCVKWTNPPQIDMSVEWCVQRCSVSDLRNTVSLITPLSTSYFVFGRRVESITFAFVIDHENVVFFVNTGTSCGIIYNNAFFEVEHLLSAAGRNNNVCYKDGIVDFSQACAVNLETWEVVSAYFKPAIRQGSTEYKIHSTVIEAKSKHNIYWCLKDSRLSISYLKDGNVVTIYEDGVVGENSCGSL